MTFVQRGLCWPLTDRGGLDAVFNRLILSLIRRTAAVTALLSTTTTTNYQQRSDEISLCVCLCSASAWSS